MQQIEHLQTLTDWEACKREIPERGLLIFKFSPRCPISKGVERDFDAWYEQLSEEQTFRCVKVDVVNARKLSRHLAEELQVRHESPQAIWITSAQTVHWHASHRSISSRALNDQLDMLSAR